MTKQEKMLMFAAAILAGLVGGGISSRLFGGDAAWAQQRKVPQVTYGADLFRAFDAQGKERAVLGPGTLTLRDASGAERVTLDGDGVRLLNSSGKPAVTLSARDQGDVIVYDMNGKPVSLVPPTKSEKTEGAGESKK